MPGKDVGRPGGQPNNGSNTAQDGIKAAWVSRAIRFIDQQRGGIEAWPADGQEVPITTLVNAYVTINTVLDGQDGNKDGGRIVRFYMKVRGTEAHEHMATLLYGPPWSTLGFMRKRRLLKTRYHV